MKKEFNYYESELEKLKPVKEYNPTIIISDDQGNKTKTLRLNNESISIIINYLKQLQKEVL